MQSFNIIKEEIETLFKEKMTMALKDGFNIISSGQYQKPKDFTASRNQDVTIYWAHLAKEGQLGKIISLVKSIDDNFKMR